MELTRMAKITVVADGSCLRDMVNKLKEAGVRYFHMLEYAGVEPVNRSSYEGSATKVLLEVLTDVNKAPGVAQAIVHESGDALGERVAVAEVTASSEYATTDAARREPAYRSWWEKDLLSI